MFPGATQTIGAPVVIFTTSHLFVPQIEGQKSQ